APACAWPTAVSDSSVALRTVWASSTPDVQQEISVLWSYGRSQSARLPAYSRMQGQKDHRRVGVCEATEALWSFLGGVGDRGAGHEFGGGIEHRRTDPWSGRAELPIP